MITSRAVALARSRPGLLLSHSGMRKRWLGRSPRARRHRSGSYWLLVGPVAGVDQPDHLYRVVVHHEREHRTAILLLLSAEPVHGYQIKHSMSDRTGGAWHPSPGAIYPTIAQVEDEGLVRTREEGGRRLVTLIRGGCATGGAQRRTRRPVRRLRGRTHPVLTRQTGCLECMLRRPAGAAVAAFDLGRRGQGPWPVRGDCDFVAACAHFTAS
jgi:hypothetical protein